GHRQEEQAAWGILAGDRRNRRADFGHHRADERAGSERGDPGRVRRRGGPRLHGGGRRSAASGGTLGRGDQADRRDRQDDSGRHAGRRGGHGKEHGWRRGRNQAL